MKLAIFKCEMCKKEARGEKQLRQQEWLQIHGGSLKGISVWLEQPRNTSGSYMHTVGFRDQDYDFCSIECLVSALKGKESI